MKTFTEKNEDWIISPERPFHSMKSPLAQSQRGSNNSSPGEIPRVMASETISKNRRRRAASLREYAGSPRALEKRAGIGTRFPPMMTPKVYRFKTQEEFEQWCTTNTETEGEELVPRIPVWRVSSTYLRHLNELVARYVVIGGFAIRGAGYPRETHDIDFIIATDLENEAKVYAALSTLPDKAILTLSR